MKHEDKINYLRIAAGIAGYSFTVTQLDLLVSLYELVVINGGVTNLDQVVFIETCVKDREKVRNISKDLDKFSKKA